MRSGIGLVHTHNCAEERGIATPSEEEYVCIVFIVLVFTFASGVYHLRIIYFFIISTALRGGIHLHTSSGVIINI